MNFLPKCLIFFLNVSITSVLFPAPEISAGLDGQINEPLPKKRSKPAKQGPKSAAAVKLKVSWQVIGSLGKGAKMSTMAETYAADGVLFQSSPQQWGLRIATIEIPISFIQSEGGREATVFAERGDLLRLFEIELTEEDRSVASARPGPSDAVLTDGVRLAVSKTPSRQLETIYRSPGDGLFLVKASLALIK